MANFVNNKPKFKVGDKVVYSRQNDSMAWWEKESINKGPLTIRKINALYENDILTDVTYFVDGLDYAYSENWLSYAPVGPKFKIGDLVEFIPGGRWGYQIEDVLTVRYQKDGHEEYLYKITGWGCGIPEEKLKAISDEAQLIHDLKICGGEFGCKGCSREDPDGGGIGCDKLELDAAELIEKLQKRVKELEEEKK